MKKHYVVRLWWGIRRKSDGAMLPDGKAKSWVEPTDNEPPRLFRSKLAATACLVMWAKGPWMLHRSKSFDGEFDEDFKTVDPTQYGQSKRVKEDFEVVPVEVRTESAMEEFAHDTARADRSAICDLGTLLLGTGKQCYSADAVVRAVKKLRNESE